jgi:hypothetical protein
MGPTLLQSLEEKKQKLGLKYMYYNVHCTYVCGNVHFGLLKFFI